MYSNISIPPACTPDATENWRNLPGGPSTAPFVLSVSTHSQRCVSRPSLPESLPVPVIYPTISQDESGVLDLKKWGSVARVGTIPSIPVLLQYFVQLPLPPGMRNLTQSVYYHGGGAAAAPPDGCGHYPPVERLGPACTDCTAGILCLRRVCLGSAHLRLAAAPTRPLSSWAHGATCPSQPLPIPDGGSAHAQRACPTLRRPSNSQSDPTGLCPLRAALYQARLRCPSARP